MIETKKNPHDGGTNNGCGAVMPPQENTPIEVPETQYQLPPEGVHVARCVGVIDIGTHPSTFGDGKKLRKVILIFELPEEKAVFVEERGEEPFHQSKIYTMSLGEKASLYKDVVSWKGKGCIETLRHNLGRLAGEPCLLNLLHEQKKAGGTRSIIVSINPLPKATVAPPQISPSRVFSILDGVAGGVYDKLPNWIQKMIMDSEEIDGEHPSEAEIAERNVRQTTANSLAGETSASGETDVSEFDEEKMNREIRMLTH